MIGLRYVYAVCRPFGTPLQAQLTGLAGAPAGLLTHHGLVAVVSTVPEADFAARPLRAHLADPAWRAAAERAHRGVIGALTTVTTPLPLRLGTVFQDDSGVRTMIEAREDDFRRTLDRLDGRVEWGVRAYACRAADGPGAARSSAARLHEVLSAHAEDARLRPCGAGDVPGRDGRSGARVLDAAYLVSRAHAEEFVELVERAGDAVPGPPGQAGRAVLAAGLQVELSGPSAAYSFAGDYL
ncbi:GvpL/GvpF family gas vesicle protein [Streptomyces sp. NPDC047000]|uniref:GvpL/GvpF family gas vesicle protein n=1 Tax=Streptomyces sp. NPDC047000 TaxID=3155474 RepID=UPI0033C72F90